MHNVTHSEKLTYKHEWWVGNHNKHKKTHAWEVCRRQRHPAHTSCIVTQNFDTQLGMIFLHTHSFGKSFLQTENESIKVVQCAHVKILQSRSTASARPEIMGLEMRSFSSCTLEFEWRFLSLIGRLQISRSQPLEKIFQNCKRLRQADYFNFTSNVSSLSIINFSQQVVESRPRPSIFDSPVKFVNLKNMKTHRMYIGNI